MGSQAIMGLRKSYRPHCIVLSAFGQIVSRAHPLEEGSELGDQHPGGFFWAALGGQRRRGNHDLDRRLPMGHDCQLIDRQGFWWGVEVDCSHSAIVPGRRDCCDRQDFHSCYSDPRRQDGENLLEDSWLHSRIGKRCLDIFGPHGRDETSISKFPCSREFRPPLYSVLIAHANLHARRVSSTISMFDTVYREMMCLKFVCPKIAPFIRSTASKPS